MLLRELMKREVVTVGPDALLVLAARTMRDQDIGCLPVIEGARLIGVITDRDIIVRGVAEGLDPHRVVVRDAMSTNAVACSVEHTVEQARGLMAAHLIKHLPVLDRRDRLVGLVALRDVTGQFGRCRPHQVTFFKRLATSSGQLAKVEVGKVYLSTAIRKEDAVPAALAKFQRERGLGRWDEAADVYELVEGGESAPGRDQLQ